MRFPPTIDISLRKLAIKNLTIDKKIRNVAPMYKADGVRLLCSCVGARAQPNCRGLCLRTRGVLCSLHFPPRTVFKFSVPELHVIRFGERKKKRN